MAQPVEITSALAHVFREKTSLAKIRRWRFTGDAGAGIIQTGAGQAAADTWNLLGFVVTRATCRIANLCVTIPGHQCATVFAIARRWLIADHTRAMVGFAFSTITTVDTAIRLALFVLTDPIATDARQLKNTQVSPAAQAVTGRRFITRYQDTAQCSLAFTVGTTFRSTLDPLLCMKALSVVTAPL